MTLHLANNDTPGRVRQGDVFPEVPYYESYLEQKGEFELTVFEFPYVIVLTQDCDLEQNSEARKKIDKNQKPIINDKYLISLIVAPLYNSEHLLAGEHLSDIGIQSQIQNSKLKGPILNNQNPRYHYLEFDDSVVLPNSIIDFKHYFSISLNYLEKHVGKRVCGINPLYRELISQRFSNYLCRIGLPNPEIQKCEQIADK